MNNFKIIAYLQQLKNSNQVVASISRYKNEIDFFNFSKNNDILVNNTNFNRKYLVINVDDYGEYNFNINIISNNTVVININSYRFFEILDHGNNEIIQKIRTRILLSRRKYIGFNKNIIKKNIYININDIFKEILNDYCTEENINIIDNLFEINVIYIFNNIIWSNIIAAFKIYRLDLFGGSSHRRHLLSISQSCLTEFLLVLNNMYLPNYIIQNSFIEKSTTETHIDILLSKTGDKMIAPNFNFDSDNWNYYENLNIKIKQYIIILELMTNLNISKKELDYVEMDIENTKKQLEKYNAIASSAWQIKKVNNKNKTISTLTDQKKSLIKSIQNLEQESQYEINFLYLMDNNIFNEEGICKFDSDIKKSSYEKFEEFSKYHIKNESSKHTVFDIFINKKRLMDTQFNNQKREYSTNNFENNNNNDNDINNDIADLKYINNFNVFLDFINDIIEESTKDPVKSQYIIETKWMEYMINKLNTIDNKSRYNLKRIITLAFETFELQKNNNSLKKKFKNIHDKLHRNHLVICYSVIFMLYKKVGYSAIAMKIANSILFNIYYNDIIKNKKIEDFITFEEYKEILQIDNDDRAFRLRLGSHFIDIYCHKPTQIFERSYKSEDTYSELDDDLNDLAVLLINEEYFNDLSNNFIINPASLPMLCQPNKWSDTEFGGFLNNIYEKNSIITTSEIQLHQTNNKDKLYNAINRLNSVKFKINNLLLNYINNDGQYLIEHFFKSLNTKSDKLQTSIILKLANSYSKLVNPFYISTCADWRGRIVSQSFYINYQGSDLSRAIVNLYNGYSLTESGLKYLYIYGANCYNEKNISKLNFKSRIQWVKKNYQDIINLKPSFMIKAESLFLFASFALILRELDKNSKYIVHLPVFLDATCSGIQHLAAMMQDLESGSKVNLIPQSEEDNVGDIYSELLDPINKAINTFGKENDILKKLKRVKLSRKHIKQPIMTKTYNNTVIGITNQLANSFLTQQIITKNNDKTDKVITLYLVPTKTSKIVKLKRIEIFQIAQIIYDQIFKSLPSLKKIYRYFLDMIQLMGKFNIPVIWITPAGLKIKQLYTITISDKISIQIGRKNKTAVLKKNTSKINKKKQSQGIIPNIIHSLDASHLINIINLAIEIKFKEILSVHDCFGCHPNYIEELSLLVKIEFISLYTKTNFLKLFHERIIQSFNDNQIKVLIDKDNKQYILPKKTKIYIPEIPIKGELNLYKIIESKHFIT